jgi:tetratricopeptide (TPR) repeat protein
MDRGRAAYRRGDTDTAIELFQRAAQLAPDKASPRLWLSNALIRAEQYSEAEAAALASIGNTELAAQKGAGYHNICRIREAQGKVTEAIRYCELSLEQRPGNKLVVERLESLRESAGARSGLKQNPFEQRPSRCRTVVDDPNPPIVVRASPSSRAARLARLDNGTEVNVVSRQDGWLQISSPANGWLWGPLTKRVCDP